MCTHSIGWLVILVEVIVLLWVHVVFVFYYNVKCCIFVLVFVHYEIKKRKHSSNII